jgi:phosphopantothenoylcysteine decarboxylase/phosphopantothenate--cysteine ligase
VPQWQITDLKSSKGKKIKKTTQESLHLELEPTVDIVATVAESTEKPFVVGFAAETEHLTQHAQDKLSRKKLDMIAANKVGEKLGFGVDENALSVFWNGGEKQLPTMSKFQLARALVGLIIEQYDAKSTT